MSFFWAGLADILSNGTGIPLDSLQDSLLMMILVGQIGRLPVQMLWAVGFAILAGVLFNRHKLGAYARYIGDNVGAAREMDLTFSSPAWQSSDS